MKTRVRVMVLENVPEDCLAVDVDFDDGTSYGHQIKFSRCAPREQVAWHFRALADLIEADPLTAEFGPTRPAAVVMADWCGEYIIRARTISARKRLDACAPIDGDGVSADDVVEAVRALRNALRDLLDGDALLEGDDG